MTAVRQKGVALLTVMFIMMLLTTLVVYLVEDDQLAIRRIENQQESEQAFQTAVYAEQWACKVLEFDIRDNNTDHIGEIWQTEKPALNGNDGGVLTAGIADLQGRFNLNNLAVGEDEVWYPAFQRLLAILDLDPSLADAVVDWVDNDIDPKGHSGAEDDVYTRQDPPYRTANRLMADVSELGWVHGMTSEAIKALRPHVTALPATGVRINVNTATPEVMRILSGEILALGQAESLITGRGKEGYAGIQDDFLVMPVLAGQGEVAAKLATVSSEYFLVRSKVDLGRFGTVLYSVIQRLAATRQARVIQRTRGLS